MGFSASVFGLMLTAVALAAPSALAQSDPATYRRPDMPWCDPSTEALQARLTLKPATPITIKSQLDAVEARFLADAAKAPAAAMPFLNLARCYYELMGGSRLTDIERQLTQALQLVTAATSQTPPPHLTVPL